MKMQNLLMTISLILLNFHCVFAITINVPFDQPTIQAGLDVAATGDIVLVAEGIYYENIVWPSTNGIKLIGMNKEYCIIDGNDQSRVISYEHWDVFHDSTNVIKNFTIQHGYWSNGAGIYLRSDNQFILENLIVKDNYLSMSFPENKTNSRYAIEGGAGIHLDNNSSPIIRNVMIYDNYAETNGGGLFIYMNSQPILQNVLIADNYTIDRGGGIYLEAGSDLELTNVTIANNFSEENGGGIILEEENSSSISITNSIFWDNSPEEIFLSEETLGDVSVSYSDLQNGENGIINNGFSNVNWLNGNIDLNPLFVNPPLGDYLLTANSPCIDAGDPSFPLDPDGTISDMGAFYFPQSEVKSYQIPTAGFNLTNFPNPFNPITMISFNLTTKSTESTEIIVYNLKGQKIRTLEYINCVDAASSQMTHSIIWNGRDETNEPVSSGIYFYQLEIDNNTVASNKCLLLK